MPVKLQMDGLAELRSALRQLPEDLAHEGDAIVTAHAEDALRRIVSAYPEGPTGNLKKRVVLNKTSSRFGTSAIVSSRAPHASIYERGTRKRRTGKGYNRGTMPKPPADHRMIPIAIKVRNQMVRALIDLVRRAGFQVDAP